MKRRKFWLRAAGLVAALLVLVRFVGVALIPGVLDSALGEMGFTSEIEEIEVSLFGGEFQLRGLVVRELDSDAAPLLAVQHVALELDMSSTLVGDPVCNRVELDGVVINLKRTAEYGWNFAPLFAGESTESEPSADEPEPEGAFDLRSPIKIVSLRAQDLHLYLEDAVSEPPIDTELTLNLTASHLGDAEREGEFEAIADAIGLLDFLRVEGAVDSNATSANVRASMAMSGVHVEPLAAWLEPLGVRSIADSIDVRGELVINAAVSGEDNGALTVTLDTNDWAVVADGVEALALDSSHHVVDLGALAIRESVLTGVRARTALEPDGAIAVAGVAWRAVSGGASEAPQEHAPPVASSEPLAWRVDSLEIREGSLVHADVSSDTDIELRLDALVLTGADSEASRPAKIELSLSAPGLFEALLVQGELTPESDAVSLGGSFDLSGCSAERCQAMLKPIGIAMRFSEAAAHGSLAVTIKRGELAGSFELSDLWLQSGEQRTALDIFRVDSFSIDDEIQLGHVVVAGVQGVLELHENGDLEVCGLVLSSGAAQPVAESTPEPANAESQVEPTKRPIVKLDHFECNELNLAFVDHKAPERSIAATRFELDVKNFAFGTEATCSLTLRAGFDAWCESVELDGTVHSMSQGDLDCDLDFRLVGLQGKQFASLSAEAEPAFETGEFVTHIGAQLRQSADGLVTSVGLNELALTLDQEAIVSLSTMSVDGLALASEGLRLDGARLAAARFLLRGQGLGSSSTLMLDAELGALIIGSSEPTELTARFGIEGDSAVVELSGEIRPDPEDLLLRLRVAAEGVDGTKLNSLLPPSVQVVLEGGTFGADVEAWFEVLEAGRIAGGVTIDDMRLGESGKESPLLLVKRVELSASNIDSAADLYELGQVHVLGAELTVLRETDGALNVAGLRIDMSGQAGAVDGSSAPEAVSPRVFASAPRWVRKYDTAPLPTVLLESVEFELAALHFEDESNAGSVPATVTAHFSHEGPLTLLAPDTESLAPLEFLLECSVQPIVEAANVKLTFAPWEEDALLKVEVAATGLQGEGVTSLLPQLKESVDGSGLVDGSLSAIFEGRLVTPRKNLLDFELRNGFGLEFSARDLVLRNGGEDVPLASLGVLDIDVERIDQATGGVKIESIEVEGLQARVELSEQGREVFGFTLKPTVAPAASEPQEPAVSEPYAGPEIQLERLSVSGLDFVITDTRTEPATVVPFDSLGFDLEQFTTKTFTEPRPFRFSFYVGAGNMSLPKPKDARSALAGLAGAALSAATGAEDKHEYEQRPALGEIALTGNLSLGPEPRGRMNANIEGLELLGFSGLARESGVIIGSGVLDAWMRVKLRGEEGVDVRSNFAFTNLSLDEPPNGPISRYLKLPASLDTVLFAIKNNGDQHRIPLRFHVDGAELGKGEIARVAVTTLTKVLTSAVASAPLRVADGVAGMLVIPGVDESPVSWVVDLVTPILRIVGLADKAGPQSDPVVLEYAAGEFVLDTEAIELLAPLLEEIEHREDFIVYMEHEFGSDDEPRAARLANPSREKCRRLVIGLRRRKRELSRYRAECSADLAASYAVNGEYGADEELKLLRAVEAELGGIELALDETLGMLRPGSDRHAARRTRSTLIEIADARMGTLRKTLSKNMKGRISDRFEIKSARPSVTSGAAKARVRVMLKMKQDE